MNEPKILLAIYHEILRDGIEAILSEVHEYTISDSVRTKDELINHLGENDYNLLIIDLEIPEMKVKGAISEIKEINKEMKILPISGPLQSHQIKQLLQSGSDGFLFKRRGKDELLKAVNLILEGGHYLCDDTIRILVDDKEISTKATDDLTEREVEILELICREHTNQDIADMLHISVRTVDAHRRNLLQKTGAKNTVGLVKYAIKNNITTP